MKRFCSLFAALALAVVIARPAAAQTSGTNADNTAHCTFKFTLYFDPGLTMTHTSGTQSTHGDVGSMSCTGRLAGANITGPGTIGVEGRYNASCLFDHTTGRYFATLPTDQGPLHIEGEYEVFRTGTTFEVRTTQPRARGSGWGLVVPLKGDCVANPLTDAQVLMTMDFRGDETPDPVCGLNLGVVQVSCRSES
jgi:hypothetical protein